METLRFNYNWNQKLNNTAFTTLRRYNKTKYIIGKEILVKFDNSLFRCYIWEVRKIHVKDLNNFICFIDTGYSIEETKEILRKMYPKDYHDDMLLHFVLLVKSDAIDKRKQRKQKKSKS